MLEELRFVRREAQAEAEALLEQLPGEVHAALRTFQERGHRERPPGHRIGHVDVRRRHPDAILGVLDDREPR